MARNRGKRPGAASGSSSPSQNQARDGQEKASGASAGSDRPTMSQADPKTPVAASQSIAAKIDPPEAGSSKTGSAAKPTGEASKTMPSTSSTGSKPPAATASAAPRAQAAKPAATTTVAAGAGSSAKGDGGRNGKASSEGGGGFWPGLIGGVIGGAATALAASLFWVDTDDQATTALESRLAEAEQQVEQIGVLNDRVAAVEAAPASAADDSALTGRLDDLETRLAELGGGNLSSGDASGGTADDGFDERVASLEQQIETLAALEQKVDALAGDVEAAGETQAANVQTLASLGSALPGLEETLAATGTSVEQASEATTRRGGGCRKPLS